MKLEPATNASRLQLFETVTLTCHNFYCAFAKEGFQKPLLCHWINIIKKQSFWNGSKLTRRTGFTWYLNSVIAAMLQPNNWRHSGDGWGVDQAIVCPSCQVAFDFYLPRTSTRNQTNPTTARIPNNYKDSSFIGIENFPTQNIIPTIGLAHQRQVALLSKMLWKHGMWCSAASQCQSDL